MERRKPKARPPRGGWVIQSLLDLDFYKLTMMQIAFLFFRFVPVVFKFKNRTVKVPLTAHIKEKDLRQQLEHIRNLRVTEAEIEYLRGLKIFGEKFLNFLRGLKLGGLKVVNDGKSYDIEVSGNWPEVTLWETMILSVVNELYYRSLLKKMTKDQKAAVFKEGRKRLGKKIAILRQNPHIQFSDFGTRRRFSRIWQEYVVRQLSENLPDTQFLGTSNVHLAMKFGIKPIGTFAHEMYMVFSRLFGSNPEDIRASHNKVLEYWWKQYGYDLSVALTDTYGTAFFFQDMTREQAEKWKGLRQDSGDPIEFGERAIKFYEGYGIDPRTKLLVFSDGLDMDMILKIAEHFKGRINVAFGWGTNLTNDLGLDALSLVVKVVMSNSLGTVKLSDNLAKAMGEEEDVELFKIVFVHVATLNEICVY